MMDRTSRHFNERALTKMAQAFLRNRTRNLVAFAALIVCISVFCARAEQDTNAAKLEQSRFTFSGYTALELGQIQYAHYAFVSSGEIDHNWIGSTYLNLSMKSHINEHLSVLGTIEARLGYDTKPLDQALDPTTFPSSQNIYLAIPNAEGIFTFGDKDNPYLTIGGGRFEYKYNPEAQNLGEYLFRTGTYPAYIRTSFDLPLARINGVMASLNLFDFLRQDLLLTTLTDIQPFTDISLTYLVDASIAGRTLSLGAGVQFASLISTMPEQTSQHQYSINGYLKAPGDTGYYTFRGTKLLGRAMFDPKRLFDAPFFGKEDCKLYVEAALLGVENYPASNVLDSFNFSNTVGYDHYWQKIPVMMGFDIPTFKILNVLALEAEWYGGRYPDSYKNVTIEDIAVPDKPPSGYTLDSYKHDDWKWSIYAEKTFYNKFSVIFQAARDHLRLHTLIVKFEDYEEALNQNKDWYWMGKIKFNF
jgi:hypothetical protein